MAVSATLDSVVIDSVNITSVVVDFTVENRIYSVPKAVIKVLKGPCDTLNVFAVNDTATITVDYNTDSNIVQFDGLVKKIETQGLYYIITCISYAQKLWEYPHNATYTSQDFIASMSGCITSPGFTVEDNTTGSQTIELFTIKDEYPAFCLSKLARFGAETSSAYANGHVVWFGSEKDSDTVCLVEMNTSSGSSTSLSHANGYIISPLKHLNTADTIINRVITVHAGGRHASNDTDNYDTASSVTAYGIRAKMLYLPNINTNADAIIIEDNYLAMYSAPKTRFTCTVKWAPMFNGGSTNHRLGDYYTVTDSQNGTTYTNISCIGYKWHWPSWKAEVEFGVPAQDLAAYNAETKATDDVFKRDSAGYGCSFKVYRNSAQSISASTTTQVNYDTEIWDTGGNFNNTGSGSNIYEFTAPISGYYHFSAHASMTIETTKNFAIYLMQNDSAKYYNTMSNVYASSQSIYLNTSGCLKMAAGDTAQVAVRHTNAGATNITTGETYCAFSGQLIATY